jgi:aquaporin Z
MAYAIGHISGCHLNPAVSFGLWAGKRFSTSDLLPYIIAQVLGAIVGAFVIYLIATGKAGFDVVKSGFAANGYEAHSPGGYSLFAALVCEIVMTYMFLYVFDRYLGRHPRASACGLCRHRHRSCANAYPFD